MASSSSSPSPSLSCSFRIREYSQEPSQGSSSNDNEPGTTRDYFVTAIATTTTATTTALQITSLQEEHAFHSNSNKIHDPSQFFRWISKSIQQIAYDLFLPLDYPSSVREGYLEYQVYDSLQGLCSYLRGVLCSAQVLQAAGVGNETATALGAALTWAMKDGWAMLGGLVFSYRAAPWFDGHVKEFRLFADLINDVGLALDFVAPYVVMVTISAQDHHDNNATTTTTTTVDGTRLLLITSTATLCKTLCGISAAATKASITQYFALRGNMADLNAKESTQETLVSLLGMMTGVTLAHQLQRYEAQRGDATSMTLQWMIFTVLTAVHVWANWRGVRLLRLPTLNRERAEVVVAQSLFRANDKTTTTTTTTTTTIRTPDDDLSWIPSPLQVNESLWLSTQKLLFTGRLHLNARLPTLLAAQQQGTMILDDSALHSSSEQQRFVLGVEPRRGKCHVHVCLLRGGGNADEIEAFVHAYIVMQRLEVVQRPSGLLDQLQEIKRQLAPWFRRGDEKNTTNLIQAWQQRGWDVEGRLYLGFSRQRTEWTKVVDVDDGQTAAEKQKEQ